VAQQEGNGQPERVTTFVTQFEMMMMMNKAEWRPIIALVSEQVWSNSGGWVDGWGVVRVSTIWKGLLGIQMVPRYSLDAKFLVSPSES